MRHQPSLPRVLRGRGVDPSLVYSNLLKSRHPFAFSETIMNPVKLKDPSSSKYVRLVAISDTHGRHRSIPIDNVHLMKGDVLIHCGDITNTGEFEQYEDFLKWVCTDTSFKKLVIIAGNHDTTVHTSYYERKGRKRFHGHKKVV